MKREFVLEIEKYLDHLVNSSCHADDFDGRVGSIDIGPPPFNEAVGRLFYLSHHRKSPPDQLGASD